MFEKRLLEIKTRLAEIRSLIKSEPGGQLDALEKEIGKLTEERSNLEKRAAILANTDALNRGAAIPSPYAVSNPVAQQDAVLTRDDALASREYRAAFFKKLQGKDLSDAEKRAWSTVADSGGAVVPLTVADEIVERLSGYAPIINYITIYNIPGLLRIPFEKVTDPAEIHVENGVITTSQDALDSIKIDGYAIVKLVQASGELLAASTARFEEFVIDQIVREIAKKINTLVFNGTGQGMPGGIRQGGKGPGGAYVPGEDLIVVRDGEEVTEDVVLSFIGAIGSGYVNNATISMRFQTFLKYFYPLWNKSKNEFITFTNGKWYLVGREIVPTDALPLGEVYGGDLKQIFGNFTTPISVEADKSAGFNTFSTMFRGVAIFGCGTVPGLGAFSKLLIEQA
jgi:Predicted phage phi-C31 gp36 major capsid-like protein